MKFGIRFKARTTGKLKRKMKKSGQSFLRQKGRWVYQKSIEVNQERDISQNHRGRTFCSPEIEVPEDFICKKVAVTKTGKGHAGKGLAKFSSRSCVFCENL